MFIPRAFRNVYLIKFILNIQFYSKVHYFRFNPWRKNYKRLTKDLQKVNEKTKKPKKKGTNNRSSAVCVLGIEWVRQERTDGKVCSFSRNPGSEILMRALNQKRNVMILWANPKMDFKSPDSNPKMKSKVESKLGFFGPVVLTFHWKWIKEGTQICLCFSRCYAAPS